MNLIDYLTKNKITCDTLAKKLGFHPVTISSLKRKKRTPSLSTAILINELTNGEVTLLDMLTGCELKDYLKKSGKKKI